jgi:Family of unknown function (DUF6152)
MHRRDLLHAAGTAGILLAVRPAAGHHGWSGFDQERPFYLSGRIKSTRWQNPHAEVMLEVPPGLATPADLASRAVPQQQQNVDGPGLLKKATVPPDAAGVWELELAPLTRMQAWDFTTPPAGGTTIEVIGYAPAGAAQRLMRVEYVFAAGRAYGLRSAPVKS